MKKILITGSAPYLPVWWKENISKIGDYHVISINTSILITLERCDEWKRSSDFYNLHQDLIDTLKFFEKKFYPISDLNQSLPLIKEEHHTKANVPNSPFHYWSNGTSGTMLFNTLNELINQTFRWGRHISEISIVGCDLIYKSNEMNHFYIGGKDDPMRLGMECIHYNLNLFWKAFDALDIKIYNLSPANETLLPFPRKTL